MRFLARSLTAVFLLALTAGLLAMAGHVLRGAIEDRQGREAPTRPVQERVVAAPVVRVTPTTHAPVLESFGEVRARRSLELRAPVGGRIVELAPGFASGETVAAGQVLMRIDPAEARSARDLAAADLARADGELRDAGRALGLAAEDLAAAEEQAELRARALDRQRDLAGRGVGTDAAVETAELALSSARQAVVSRRQALAQAEARRDQADTALTRQTIALADAERRLADTVLTAAFSGRLAEVTAVAGGLVTPNERIGQLIDPEDLEVAFRVSTAQYARLLAPDGSLLATPVRVTLDGTGSGDTAEGVLDRVGAAVGEGQSGRELHARMTAPAELFPGDFVRVAVEETPLDGVVRLPARALDAADRVLVVGADGRLAEAQVELLRRQGESVIVAAPGLAGAEVVAARTPLLGAGIRVRPIRPEAAEAADPEAGTVALSAARRAELIGRVEANPRMPSEAKARLIAQLEAERVPAALVARLDAQTGG
jgi:multidrug efflux pump subunit AcrA (membrane-fusion protein)